MEKFSSDHNENTNEPDDIVLVRHFRDSRPILIFREDLEAYRAGHEVSSVTTFELGARAIAAMRQGNEEEVEVLRSTIRKLISDSELFY